MSNTHVPYFYFISVFMMFYVFNLLIIYSIIYILLLFYYNNLLDILSFIISFIMSRSIFVYLEFKTLYFCY